MNTIEEQYRERHPILEIVANEIRSELVEILSGVSHIDYISARAKGVESFVQKALKTDENGERKYSDPLNQIQDQVGVRIVVYFLSDVDVIKERVLSNYIPVENLTLGKGEKDPSQFSYQGQHFVCHIPLAIHETNRCPVTFFELQVHTLFQHAWAAANHDIGYKAKGHLALLEQRKLAWAAAQAWGADTIFDELLLSQHNPPQN